MCIITSTFMVSVMTAGHYLGKLQQKFSTSDLPVEEKWLHFSIYKIPCTPTDVFRKQCVECDH